MTDYFLFLVNPRLAYDPYPDWERWQPIVESGGEVATTWNTGTRRTGMAPGDRGFIVKTGVHPKGLVGMVTLASEIYTGPHWNPEASQPETGYVDMTIDLLIDLDDPVGLDELALLAPGVLWTPRQSGTKLDRRDGSRVWETIMDAGQSPEANMSY